MNLYELLARHGYTILLVALTLEEMGIPMPVPTDVLIVMIGYEIRAGQLNLLPVFLLMQIGVNIGAGVLYAVSFYGGRPLVERWGPYVHLSPKALVRAERWIVKRGWLGIAVGRAIPGVRYATVIACGVFRVPFLYFLSAQVVGTSLYMIAFLSLGWFFGPSVVRYVHVLQGSIRLLLLTALALGLLTLAGWFYWQWRRNKRLQAEAHHTDSVTPQIVVIDKGE